IAGGLCDAARPLPPPGVTAMTCTEVRQHWMLYLDSEGDLELHLRIRDHLAECPACAKWFTEQQQLEKRINKHISAGNSTPDLWRRVLSQAGIQLTTARRRRWPAVAGGLIAAAILLLALVIGLQIRGRSPSTELARNAALWHEQWQQGNVHPDFVSTSDHDVERY